VAATSIVMPVGLLTGTGYALRFIELMRMGHLAQHAAFCCRFVGQRGR
jgi:hypothetical protein